MQTVLYCNIRNTTDVRARGYMLTISCIPSSFCAFIIINRKMAGEMLEADIPAPFHWAFPFMFQLTFGMHVYIACAGRLRAGLVGGAQAGDAALDDVVVRTCVFSSDVTSSTCILFAGD